MNKLLITLFALSVACATSLAQAQAAPAASAAPVAAAAPAAAAAPVTPASPKSLEAKTAMCFGCHGIVGYKGTFPEVYRVPKIAGQNAKYIAAALNAYKSGDRKHPTMRGIAASLSDQDIADISNYYEHLGAATRDKLGDKPDQEPDAQVAGLIQKAACFSCHGSNLSKPIDPSYPKISGQYPDYVFVALKAYKTTDNPDVGRNNGVMGAIAKQFSNPELKALANYVGSLDSELQTVPESRFHKR
ncbi:MAG: c-type cytochrome [Burkholderiales bacterium]